MQTFIDAGVSERVRLVYPRVENGMAAVDTMVHSKVMVVDDRFLRVGSANLNNRSMGTDTECDLAIEAADTEDRAGILDVRNRLLADHCGVPAEKVASFFAGGGSLLEAAEALTGHGHSLRLVDDGTPDTEEMARYIEAIADPERPVAAKAFAAMEVRGLAPRLGLAQFAKLGAALLAVIALTLVWHLTPLADLIQPSSLAQVMAAFADSRLAPVYVIAGFLAGGIVAFPLLVMIAATAAAFGPFLGFTYALLGSIANALLTYAIGAWLGAAPLRSLHGPRLNRIRAAFARSGIAGIAVIRLVPVAPFTIVNMVAGATRIPLPDYVVGTVLGLLPGLLVMSSLGHQLFSFMVAPTTSGFLVLAGAVIVWALVAIGAQRLALKLGAKP
jgi:uncharacterized membrane protein YdjX (TVP38/TMEM64 family)